MPGPFCSKGFPRLCSLSLVICVLFCDFGYCNTRKSRRTASTDGGNLLGNTGLALQRGAVFEVFSCCRQPSTPKHQTDTQKGPQISQKGPQISSPGRQKHHPSAAPGPFSQTGFPRLCSLYSVICVFLRIQNRKKTRKSPRTASTDGGSLFG